MSGAARVVDGDTLEIAGERVRLEGIDAPEASQTCGTASGGQWACGRAAIQSLRSQIGAFEVTCERRGSDKYGRTLGICFANGSNLNEAMVNRGLAWAFVKYSKEFVDVEAQARVAKIGVWQGSAEAPWDVRQKSWQSAEMAAPDGCAIKGNISDGGRIYHPPWSPWYAKVQIDLDRGERWFCSEGEAVAAGWRPAAAP
ncbi:MAG: thermonuclease family protein [Hyphomicrobium sp.]